MNICHECGESTVKKHGDIEVQRPEIGKFVAKRIIYMGCDNCGAKIVFPEYAEKINKKALELHIIKIMKVRKRISIFDLVKEVGNSDLMYEAIDNLIKEKTIKETVNDKKIKTLIYIKKESDIKENWLKTFFKKIL